MKREQKYIQSVQIKLKETIVTIKAVFNFIETPFVMFNEDLPKINLFRLEVCPGLVHTAMV